MLVVAIMAVLFTAAGPAAIEWIATQRLRDAATDLQTSMMRARNEAVTRGLPTSVTPVGGNWASGWYIANPDATYNPNIDAPTVFIEQIGPVAGAVISGAGAITFSAVGRLGGCAALKVTVSGAATVNSKVTTGTKTQVARCVTVDIAGRPRIVQIGADEPCAC